jgi:hypothetical protein
VKNENPLVSVTVHGQSVGPVSRRQAIQWVLGAVAASALPTSLLAQEVGRTVTPQKNAARQLNITAKGYGTDPDLLKTYKPGDVWPLTFDATQKATATALADIIIPKDKWGPAASEVGVVEMVDEWISAPYPDQQAHRPIILEVLAWLNTISTARFNQPFPRLDEKQQHEICDDICFAPKAKPEHRKGAHFFSLFRSLCAGAYYATPPGWNAIGYVGNVALPSFEGPPPEVLKLLDVAQTVP